MYGRILTGTRSARRTLVHAALVAGLGISLVGSTIPTTAWAADATITINQQLDQKATYDAYCLFTADVSEDDVVTHLAWASPEVKQLVLAFLDNEGYQDWLAQEHPGDEQHEYAQNAASYLASKIEESGSEAGEGVKAHTVEGRSFAHRLAQALATSSSVSPRSARAGEPFTGAEGYWLFVSAHSNTDDAKEAGTAPLWVTLGGSVTTINEKASLPTVVKEVREDSTQAWGKAADAHAQQDLTYRLTATLPDNYHSFDQYRLCFTDKLAEGLELELDGKSSVLSALNIHIGDKSVPKDSGAVTATYTNHVLTVDFANLKDAAWDSYTIGDTTSVTVEYQAHLSAQCTTGGHGNLNGVSLTYTNDPIWNGDGHTQENTDTTKTFAYQLHVQKQDRATKEPLAGAEFSVQVASSNKDSASRGLYVQKDGSLGSSPYLFTTASDGSFTITGIDEGTYTLTEVNPPQSFSALERPITFTISSKFKDEGRELDTIEATIEGVTDQQNPSAGSASIASVETQTGIVSMHVTNDRQLLMPLTGMGGVGASPVVGAAMLLAAAGGVLAKAHRRP